MYRTLFILVLLLSLLNFADGQVPESFKYQTIVRNANSEIIANQQVTVEIDILQGSVTGNLVCQETFTPTTNAFGLVNLEIGSQNPQAFSVIDWSDGPYFVKIILNGNEMGTSELLSVPYAIYSRKSEAVDVPSMTYEELYAIQDPTTGMMVLCTDCEPEDNGSFVIFKSGNWYKLNTECLKPLAPTAGLHDTTQTQITWHWNAVTGAVGYKFNTNNDYSTAVDLGNVNTKIEDGLFCSTSYTRYLWAYSSACSSDVTVLTQITAQCGDPIPCPGIPTVDYEGQVYHTVIIGDQCWLAENLNCGIRVNGASGQTNNGDIEKYCYVDLPANCDTYGGLYQWREMMKYTTVEGSQGICPDGWHIPTDAEWCSLLLYLDESVICYVVGATGTDVGHKLKARSGWDPDEDGNGSNVSGFTALPGGVRNTSYYEGKGWASDFWTSTPNDGQGANYYVCGSNSPRIARYNSDFYSGHAMAVRCLKDE